MKLLAWFVLRDFAPDVDMFDEPNSLAMRAWLPALRDEETAMRLIRLAIVISMLSLTKYARGWNWMYL